MMTLVTVTRNKIQLSVYTVRLLRYEQERSSLIFFLNFTVMLLFYS